MSDVFTSPEVLVSHANARLTVHGRMLIVQRREQGWKQAHIAAAMGVSRKTVRYWLHRFITEGEAGLHDRSSRPHRCPTRTPAQVEAKVVALRRAERRGRDQIAAQVGLPPGWTAPGLMRRPSQGLRQFHPPARAGGEEHVDWWRRRACPPEGRRPGSASHGNVML